MGVVYTGLFSALSGEHIVEFCAGIIGRPTSPLMDERRRILRSHTIVRQPFQP